MKNDKSIIKFVLFAVVFLLCYKDILLLDGNQFPAEEHQRSRVKRAAPASNLNVTLQTTGEWINMSDIRISDKVPFNLTITVPVGSYNMTSSVLTSDVTSICSMSVISVGSNFVGIQPSDYLPTFDKDTTSGTHLSYNNLNATIEFGPIENNGNEPNDSESEIVIQFDVIVVNSSHFTNGGTYTVTANVTLDSYTESAFLLFTGIEQSLFSITPPIANVSSPGPLLVGDIANWTVTLDLQDAVNKVQVKAWVNGTYEYPACNMLFGNIGPAFTCLEEDAGIVSKLDNHIFFEIPIVINTEFNQNVTVAEGTLLEILVLARVPSYVTVADTLFLNVEIYLDDKLVFPLSELIDTVSNTLPSPGVSPQILIGTVDNVTTVAIGSAIVFSVDVVTPPESVTIYNVTITTDAGLATICDVQLMKIGDNLCMDSVVYPSYISTTSNSFYDEVNINVGSVPNLNGSTVSTSIENNFQFEVAVCVPDYSTVTVGDVLTLTVEVFYDATSPNVKVTESMVYTVASTPDPSLAAGNIYFSNSSVVQGFIGQRVEMNATAVFEQITDTFTLSITSPVINENSLVFLESATIAWVGPSLSCLENRTLTLLSNDSVSYSQTILLVYRVGPVTHTGMTERNPYVETNSTGMNELVFMITVMVADHVANTQGSIIPINVTLDGASGLSVAGGVYVEVQITGIEAPHLIFLFALTNYINKTSGDNVTGIVNLYLHENSTAHAQNVLVNVYLPYYIGFDTVFDFQDANVTQISHLPEPGMSFSIAEIDFRDNVSFSFNLILDPARQLPMGMDYVETVLPVDMTTRGAQRPDRADTGVMYTQLLVYEFGFSTESPNVIGMESGVIQNCQITASSYLDTNRPEEARLNTGSGWKPLVRGAPFCTDEYLQINIGTSAYITGLQLQSTTNSYQDIVASFKLQFSDDGVIWYDVMTHTGISQMVFEVSVSGAGSVSDVYDVDLNETERFNAQYVRVISGPCLLGLRLELKGLKYTGPTVDCSTISETVTPVTEQSYVVDSAKGNIFVCGLESVGGDVYCSFSDDNGASWLEIDDNLSNIIALVSNTSIVVGKANDNVTLLVSEDDGFTWNALTDEYFNELQAMAGYTEFKTFPYEDTRGQSFNDMYATYGMDGPGSMSLTGTISGIAVTDGGTWIETAWWGTDDWNLL